MNPLVKAEHAELERLCDRYHVRRLALFGSATRPDFDPAQSDQDFLVEFEELPPGQHADCYFGLLGELEQLFQRPIDLVEYAPIRNPYFLREIQETQVMLYEAA